MENFSKIDVFHHEMIEVNISANLVDSFDFDFAAGLADYLRKTYFFRNRIRFRDDCFLKDNCLNVFIHGVKVSSFQMEKEQQLPEVLKTVLESVCHYYMDDILQLEASGSRIIPEWSSSVGQYSGDPDGGV